MATIAENLQILVDNKADIKEAIERVIAEDNITLRMSAWADLLHAYEDKLQDATSNTAFPFRFPITFKPEQTISKFFPFNFPFTFSTPPLVTSTSNPALMALLYQYNIASNPDVFTYTEAAQVTSLGTMGTITDTTVTSFDEFEAFTGMTTIPDGYFSEWRTLKSIKLPNTITTIGNRVLDIRTSHDSYGTPRVTFTCTSFTIPDSVTSIGIQFFNVYFKGELHIGTGLTSLKNWFCRFTSPTTLTIPNNITHIAEQNFAQLRTTTTLILSENLTKIDNFSVGDLILLPQIKIPNSVTHIETGCMQNLRVATTIDFGTGLKRIGTNSFNGVSNNYLRTLIVRAVTPPSLVTTAFNSMTNCSLYVPRASISLYESATNWTLFTGRIYAIEDMEESLGE